jgi:ABC-2 type transport system permease protein
MVFAHTESLGGWSPSELLALLGVYFLVGGAINLVIQPSMQRLMEQVRLGTLDFTLTKPEDTQLLVSVQEVRIWKLIDVALGLAILATALARLGAEVGPWTALTFGATLLAGGAIVYSFWLMLATLSFWFVRVDNILVIFQSMYEAGRWPIGIYPPWLRVSLTFIVPVAFATSVPAEALVGRLTLPTLLGVVGLAALMLAVSRWFWGIGVRRYSGASA